ncbi:MAG: potassium channel family protein [Phycisphaerae bacterium]
MKQVVVIGLGQFGSHLARELTKMHCEVLAVDNLEDRVADLRDDVHQVFVADARSLDTLKSLFTASVDEAVVSLGESMEVSILCTLHLSQIGVQKIRTKAVNEDHALILKAVGAHEVIFPERDTAERTARRIAHPHFLDFFPFAEEYRIMEVVVPKEVAGKTLRESDIRKNYRLLVLATRSGTQGEFHFMPTPDQVLNESEVLVVLGREVDLARFSAID